MSYTHLSQNERYQIHTMLDLLPVADTVKTIFGFTTNGTTTMVHGSI